MVAFTEGGCQEYIELNGHNDRSRAHKGEIRIYAESFRRCPEMIAIREWLMARRPLVSKTTKQEDSPQFVAYRSPDGDLLGECGEGEAPASPATEAALSFEAWFNSQDLPFVVMGGKKNAEYMTHCAWHARDREIAALRDALKGITEHYCGLVNSGDAGHWNPEEDQEVIAARLALNQKPLP